MAMRTLILPSCLLVGAFSLVLLLRQSDEDVKHASSEEPLAPTSGERVYAASAASVESTSQALGGNEPVELQALLSSGLEPSALVEVLSGELSEESERLLIELFAHLSDKRVDQAEVDRENLELRRRIVQKLAEGGGERALSRMLTLASMTTLSREDRLATNEIANQVTQITMQNTELLAEAQAAFSSHEDPRMQTALVFAMVAGRRAGTEEAFASVYRDTESAELRRHMLVNAHNFRNEALVNECVDIGVQYGLINSSLAALQSACERWPDRRSHWASRTSRIAQEAEGDLDFRFAIEALLKIDPLAVFDFRDLHYNSLNDVRRLAVDNAIHYIDHGDALEEHGSTTP